MPTDSYVFEGSARPPPFVPTAYAMVVPNVVVVAAHKSSIKAEKAKMAGRGNSMKWGKWQLFSSTFVLNKMCEIIASEVRTNKGFKELH